MAILFDTINQKLSTRTFSPSFSPEHHHHRIITTHVTIMHGNHSFNGHHWAIFFILPHPSLCNSPDPSLCGQWLRDRWVRQLFRFRSTIPSEYSRTSEQCPGGWHYIPTRRMHWQPRQKKVQWWHQAENEQRTRSLIPWTTNTTLPSSLTAVVACATTRKNIPSSP